MARNAPKATLHKLKNHDSNTTTQGLYEPIKSFKSSKSSNQIHFAGLVCRPTYGGRLELIDLQIWTPEDRDLQIYLIVANCEQDPSHRNTNFDNLLLATTATSQSIAYLAIGFIRLECLASYPAFHDECLMSIQASRDAQCDGTGLHFGASPCLLRPCMGLYSMR
jgi:hypothetical protein